MRGGLRTMERVLHGETQGGHTGRAWRIRLAEKKRGTKRPGHAFRHVARPKTHRSETTTVGSLLRCVHTIQIKLRGRQGRQDLLWCASIRIGLGWLRPESRERRVQFALCWHHLSHTNTHSNIQIALVVRVASKCYAGAPPLRHVYTVGKNQYLCSTIGMFWGNNKLECPLHYWLVRCERHERRVGLEKLWICYIRITYMLFKGTSHMHVRLNSTTCICCFENIYMLFGKKDMFFKKHNMTDKKICRLKNMFFKKHTMTDKKIKICFLRNIIWRIRNIHMTDKP